jgi:hypothetical protein
VETSDKDAKETIFLLEKKKLGVGISSTILKANKVLTGIVTNGQTRRLYKTFPTPK